MENRNYNYLENLTFSPEFFQDEVREGFLITSMMKRYWASQLTVLAEIARVCRKHSINWFADCGTLLGAVRHGGYIPWDDDLDICMLRSDYERFFKVAKKELPSDWCVITVHTESEQTSMVGRIVNSHAINLEEEFLMRFHGCPYTTGVDIFALDDLNPDETLEEERRQKIILVNQTLQNVLSYGPDDPSSRKLLLAVESKTHFSLHRDNRLPQQLRILTDRLYSACTSDKATYVALMYFWAKDHNHKYDKKWFEHASLMPFENTWLPVPAVHDAVLRVEYGNYMTVHKGGGIHLYPAYKEQEKILAENAGQNPYRYTLSSAALPPVRSLNVLPGQWIKITDTLKEAHTNAASFLASGKSEELLSLLTLSQSLAVSLGNMIEEKYGEGQEVIHTLEKYCEELYLLSCDSDASHIKELDVLLDLTLDGIRKAQNTRHKDILFLPCKAQWWSSMEPLWKKECESPENTVNVIPIPYLEGDMFGQNTGTAKDDFSLFPAEIHPVKNSDYDIARRHPDVIYIQFPFDGASTTLKIPEFFHSENLRIHTDQLIYVPCFDPEIPVNDQDKAYAPLNIMIEQPAVVNSDLTLVSSESLRDIYVRKLNELSNAPEGYWAEKIQCQRRPGPDTSDRTAVSEFRETVSFLPEEWQKNKGVRKLLLVRISLSFFLEHGAASFTKLYSVADTLDQAKDSIMSIYSPDHDIDPDMLKNTGVSDKYNEWLDYIGKKDSILYDPDRLIDSCFSNIDAYYGTPGKLANLCRYQNIPVMLINPEV